MYTYCTVAKLELPLSSSSSGTVTSQYRIVPYYAGLYTVIIIIMLVWLPALYERKKKREGGEEGMMMILVLSSAVGRWGALGIDYNLWLQILKANNIMVPITELCGGESTVWCNNATILS